MQAIELKKTRTTCIEYKDAKIFVRFKKYLLCWLIRLEFPRVEGKPKATPRCYCLTKDKGIDWAKRLIDAKESKDSQAVLDLIINQKKYADVVPDTRYIRG
jgi:hypothetical protein